MCKLNIKKLMKAVVAIAAVLFTIEASSQNVGVNNANPTHTLDVNGSLRIRGGNPAQGKVWVSTDAAGHGEWRYIPEMVPTIAFRIQGSGFGGASVIPPLQNIRIPFNAVILNEGGGAVGFNNQAGYSTFTAPISGLYQFTLQVCWNANDISRPGILFVRQRGADNRVITTNYYPGNSSITSPTHSLSLQLELLSGDQVWVAATHTSSSSRIIDQSSRTFFSGLLLRAY